MAEGPDGSEYGPASQYFANLEYYSAIGEPLTVYYGDDAFRFVPGENLSPEDVQEVALGINVRVTELRGLSVEQTTIDGEPLTETVQWVEGGFTFAQQHANDGTFTDVDEVIIGD